MIDQTTTAVPPDPDHKPPAPCPTCGRCPTCGHHPAPPPAVAPPVPFPYAPWIQPPATAPYPWWQLPQTWCYGITYASNAVGPVSQ